MRIESILVEPTLKKWRTTKAGARDDALQARGVFPIPDTPDSDTSYFGCARMLYDYVVASLIWSRCFCLGGHRVFYLAPKFLLTDHMLTQDVLIDAPHGCV